MNYNRNFKNFDTKQQNHGSFGYIERNYNNQSKNIWNTNQSNDAYNKVDYNNLYSRRKTNFKERDNKSNYSKNRSYKFNRLPQRNTPNNIQNYASKSNNSHSNFVKYSSKNVPVINNKTEQNFSYNQFEKSRNSNSLDSQLESPTIKIKKNVSETITNYSINEKNEVDTNKPLQDKTSKTIEKSLEVNSDLQISKLRSDVKIKETTTQLEKKILSQLTNMDKNNIKRIINTPNTKFESTLQLNARKKIRTEVRKQLKSCNIKDNIEFQKIQNIFEPDEYVDADKVPEVLYDEISRVLDTVINKDSQNTKDMYDPMCVSDKNFQIKDENISDEIFKTAEMSLLDANDILGENLNSTPNSSHSANFENDMSKTIENSMPHIHSQPIQENQIYNNSTVEDPIPLLKDDSTNIMFSSTISNSINCEENEELEQFKLNQDAPYTENFSISNEKLDLENCDLTVENDDELSKTNLTENSKQLQNNAENLKNIEKINENNSTQTLTHILNHVTFNLNEMIDSNCSDNFDITDFVNDKTDNQDCILVEQLVETITVDDLYGNASVSAKNIPHSDNNETILNNLNYENFNINLNKNKHHEMTITEDTINEMDTGNMNSESDTLKSNDFSEKEEITCNIILNNTSETLKTIEISDNSTESIIIADLHKNCDLIAKEPQVSEQSGIMCIESITELNQLNKISSNSEISNKNQMLVFKKMKRMDKKLMTINSECLCIDEKIEQLQKRKVELQKKTLCLQKEKMELYNLILFDDNLQLKTNEYKNTPKSDNKRKVNDNQDKESVPKKIPKLSTDFSAKLFEKNEITNKCIYNNDNNNCHKSDTEIFQKHEAAKKSKNINKDRKDNVNKNQNKMKIIKDGISVIENEKKSEFDENRQNKHINKNRKAIVTDKKKVSKEVISLAKKIPKNNVFFIKNGTLKDFEKRDEVLEEKRQGHEKNSYVKTYEVTNEKLKSNTKTDYTKSNNNTLENNILKKNSKTVSNKEIILKKSSVFSKNTNNKNIREVNNEIEISSDNVTSHKQSLDDYNLNTLFPIVLLKKFDHTKFHMERTENNKLSQKQELCVNDKFNDEKICKKNEVLSTIDENIEVDQNNTDNQLFSFETPTWKCNKFQGLKVNVSCIRYRNNFLLAGTEKGKIYRYILKNGKLDKVFNFHKLSVTGISVDSEDYVYSISLDGIVTKFHLKDDDIPIKMQNISKSLQAVDVNWNYVFTSSNTGEVFNITTNALKVSEICKVDHAILALKATKEGPRKVLIIAAEKCNIEVRDAINGLLLRIIIIKDNLTIHSLSVDQGFLFCGTNEDIVLCYEFISGKHHENIKSSAGSIRMKTLNDNIFIGCHNSYIYIYNMKLQKNIGRIEGIGQTLLDFEITNKKIIVSTNEKSLYIADIPRNLL